MRHELKALKLTVDRDKGKKKKKNLKGMKKVKEQFETSQTFEHMTSLKFYLTHEHLFYSACRIRGVEFRQTQESFKRLFERK